MTTEDLLRVRYKVIADWPGSIKNEIGDIWEAIPNRNGLYSNVRSGDKSGMSYEKYPHLFRLLQWWEDRKPEDMPEYVKDSEGVFKARFDFELTSTYWMFLDERGAHPYKPSWFEPATLEEYQSFINSSQIKG